MIYDWARCWARDFAAQAVSEVLFGMAMTENTPCLVSRETHSTGPRSRRPEGHGRERVRDEERRRQPRRLASKSIHVLGWLTPAHGRVVVLMDCTCILSHRPVAVLRGAPHFIIAYTNIRSYKIYIGSESLKGPVPEGVGSDVKSVPTWSTFGWTTPATKHLGPALQLVCSALSRNPRPIHQDGKLTKLARLSRLLGAERWQVIVMGRRYPVSHWVESVRMHVVSGERVEAPDLSGVFRRRPSSLFAS